LLPELIAFVSFIVIFTLLLISNILIRIKNRKLVKEATQLNIDKLIFLDKIEKLIQDKDNKALEESDGFLRFMSESRDWAFKYIEDVQASISELMSAVESKNDDKIESAFKALKDFLPNEEENIKNNNKEKND
jgi:GTP-binding protein EngB required for normal cell division